MKRITRAREQYPSTQRKSQEKKLNSNKIALYICWAKIFVHLPFTTWGWLRIALRKKFENYTKRITRAGDQHSQAQKKDQAKDNHGNKIAKNCLNQSLSEELTDFDRNLQSELEDELLMHTIRHKGLDKLERPRKASEPKEKPN